jgi:hypothetical protein
VFIRHLAFPEVVLDSGDNKLKSEQLSRRNSMKTCAVCRNELSIDKYFSRKSICPKCGGDLHICHNCKFYSESAHNKCIETKAEFQRSRDKANFCDYFVFRDAAGASSAASKEDARKKLDDLFKK